jgi:hypothetical protein
MYKIKSTVGQTTLDPDTFCPLKNLDIRLSLMCEAQHDGHGWTEESAQEAQDDLFCRIMHDIRKEVSAFIRAEGNSLYPVFRSEHGPNTGTGGGD